MKHILGSVIYLIMGVCFFRIPYHAVLLGRPVLEKCTETDAGGGGAFLDNNSGPM